MQLSPYKYTYKHIRTWVALGHRHHAEKNDFPLTRLRVSSLGGQTPPQMPRCGSEYTAHLVKSWTWIVHGESIEAVTKKNNTTNIRQQSPFGNAIDVHPAPTVRRFPSQVTPHPINVCSKVTAANPKSILPLESTLVVYEQLEETEREVGSCRDRKR